MLWIGWSEPLDRIIRPFHYYRPNLWYFACAVSVSSSLVHFGATRTEGCREDIRFIYFTVSIC